MTETTCPRCGEHASGNFCAHCGAPLGERFCNQCGERMEAGARFCNQCGAPVVPAAGGTGAAAPAAAPPGPAPTTPVGASGAGGGGQQLAWWISGAFMVALILFVVYPMVAPDDQAGSNGVGGAGPAAPFADQGGAGAGAVDLSSMTPLQAADRLYNRVMSSFSSGDSAGAQQFLPMAIQAYDMARPLDADRQFHLALLQLESGDAAAALATAQEGLEDAPDHLLLLSAAGQAAAAEGDADAARQYYSHLLDVWDAEEARDLPEYGDHQALLPEIRAQARDFLGS